MNQLLQNILIFFFSVNAIFWGLMPHSIHCSVVSSIIPECPSHKIHIGFGIFSFIVATIIAQYKHFL